MTRAEKSATIEVLKEKISNSSFFYITDSSTLTVEQVNKLRRMCFEKGIEMTVVKNTLVKKALEAAPQEKNYEPLYEALHGPTALMFTEVANLPARLIKEFRGDKERPAVKAAYIDTAVYIGDDQLEALSSLKSRDELLGDLLGLLSAPAANLLGALQSGGSNIMGLLKALEERGE
ncbi:MAG TPA: 50S ribosomal protein L10 [Saprospiraceae bacterium]|nr:50S ribosomal protein L10 [Saprospiraceae bacterium]HMP14066.1 50S ribosomal protein L10 [Saprospiraceae bacterium]